MRVSFGGICLVAATVCIELGGWWTIASSALLISGVNLIAWGWSDAA